MIGRNIDELKIAQTIMFHKNDEWSEESVMQLVLSVKEFINLCNRGAFNNVRKQQNLPTEEEAILHLLIGDTSYAMALMEALIDELLTLDNPYHCPHGRPTTISMTKQEIEKRFKRIVDSE